MTRILDYRNSSQYECYGYDTHNRLVGAFTGDSSCASYSSTGYAPFDHDYAYDDLHNLTSLDGPTYTYGTGNEVGSGDAGPHAVVAIGTGLSFPMTTMATGSLAPTTPWSPPTRTTPRTG